MTIQEYAQIIDVTLEIDFFPHHGVYHACFECAEVKDRMFLRSAYGTGDTPDEAIRDYVEQIRGKRLVIDAIRDSRREFNVPKTLEASEVAT